jgi:hypothetical protein
MRAGHVTWGSAAAILVAGTLAVTSSGAGAHARAREGPGPGPTTGIRFAEGEWEIFLDAGLNSLLIRGDVNGASASTLHGDGNFKVGHDGDVTGTYSIGGTVAASAITSTGSGQGDLNIAGKDQPITGSRQLVSLSGVLNVSGTVHANVSGISVDVPISVDGPIGGDRDAPLQVDWATCNGADGDWTPALRASAAAQGLDVTGEGRFQALRFALPSGPEAERFNADAATFGRDVASFVDRANAGTYDVAALYTLLDRGEALVTEIPALAACSALPSSELYSTFLAGDVRTLVELAIAQGARVPTAALLALANAAYGSGAIGAAASSSSDDLEVELRDAIGARLDEAIAAGDRDTTLDITVTANQFGWSDLAARGGAAL